jgi:RNA polymerase sigma-70 factor (ECF subfamily)
MRHAEEDDLIRRAQAGEHAAYVALLECYGKGIYRLLLGLTKNTHAAEDLVQEVFLKAWAHLKSFRAGTCFQAWLVRIARNTFLNSRRSSRVQLRQGYMDTLATREPGPVAACLARETKRLVADAEARLPATTRAAYCLRAREGLAFQDVGRALSLTAATARWHVFQARRLLRQRLGSRMFQDF